MQTFNKTIVWPCKVSTLSFALRDRKYGKLYYNVGKKDDHIL